MADDLKETIKQNAEGPKSDRWHRHHGTGRFGEIEVGVEAHRQAAVAMTQELLSGGGRGAVATREPALAGLIPPWPSEAS